MRKRGACRRARGGGGGIGEGLVRWRFMEGVGGGGGVNWDKMGQNKDFPRKSGLKTAFLRDKNSDQLTLGGSDTHIFEGIANFHMCFEKIGT